MPAIVFFALISVVGALLMFLGAKSKKLGRIFLILLGIVLLLPGVYGVLTSLF